MKWVGGVDGGGGGVLTRMLATPLKTSCLHLHTYLILRCSWTCTGYILNLETAPETRDVLRALACNKCPYGLSKVAIMMKTLVKRISINGFGAKTSCRVERRFFFATSCNLLKKTQVAGKWNSLGGQDGIPWWTDIETIAPMEQSIQRPPNRFVQ